MVNRTLTAPALLLPLILAGASPTETDAPARDEPAWSERRFDTQPAAVRAALSTVMEQVGLSIDPDAAAQPHEVVTLWQRFHLEDFGPSVARDTPPITRDYPFVSPIRLRQGLYRLRARILPRDGGTVLTLRAELLADAYNLVEFEQQQVERFSNGVIEDSLHGRVQRALDRGPGRD